jgi:hypothetical protein
MSSPTRRNHPVLRTGRRHLKGDRNGVKAERSGSPEPSLKRSITNHRPIFSGVGRLRDDAPA